MFWLIVSAIPLLGLIWWWWADRRLRRLERPRPWRLGLAAFVVFHGAAFVWLFASRYYRTDPPPQGVLVTTYIWSLVVLPLAVGATASIVGIESIVAAVRAGARLLRGRSRAAASDGAEPPAPARGARIETVGPVEPGISRRRALASLAMVGGPVLTQGAAFTRGLSQLDEFRVREFDVPCPSLPTELDGLTIAHVSDTHVGRFTKGRVLDAIARRVSELDCDLVCFTGDLIDYTIADLPEALAMARDFRSRHGVFVCEGNHDLFEDRAQFRRGVSRAGLGLLVNESATVEIRGRRVQLLGLRWGAEGPTRGRGAQHEANAETLARTLDPGAFQVLLAHHPHSFDDAARLGIPLTLAGHTHGGQFNFAEGVGLVRHWYKYMSGLYTQPGAGGTASCVVSNGVGNWFPLRVNAPAEVVRVTLISARSRTLARSTSKP